MDTRIPTWHELLSRHTHSVMATCLLGVIGAALWLGKPSSAPLPRVPSSIAPAPVARLLRWRDARHDWLLVVDPAAGELVIYQTVDGKPLARLGAGQGLAGVREVSRQDDLLWVRTRDKEQLLRLPDLAPVALAAR